MKFFILILISNAIKCEGSCGFDNKTAQLFWKRRFSFIETLPLGGFLYYYKLKRKLESILNLNHPNLQCDINEICNTKFSYKAPFYCEDDYKYDFGNGLSNDIYPGIDLSYDDIELLLEYYSSFCFEEYSFCCMFQMFEHKTKFVLLIDHFELWLFSLKNFTIHSNQLTTKSGNSFFTTR